LKDILVTKESSPSSPSLQTLRNNLLTGPRASQSFDVAQARAHLTAEASRLRSSGSGGYGGLSLEALSIADAIDRVLNSTIRPDLEAAEAAKHLAAEAQRLRSGGAGYGGLSLEALSIADAIDRVGLESWHLIQRARTSAPSWTTRPPNAQRRVSSQRYTCMA
jgi:hypothetical protein